MGSGNSNQNFIATVAVKVDPATLAAAGQAIQKALTDATKGVDIAAFKQLAEAVKVLGENSEKLNALSKTRNELAKEELATTKQAEASAKEMAMLEEKLAKQKADAVKNQNALIAASTILADLQKQQALQSERATVQAEKYADAENRTVINKRTIAELERAQTESDKQQERSQREMTALIDAELKANSQVTQTENARVAAYAQLKALQAEQVGLLNQQLAISEKLANTTPFAVNPNFNLGNLAGSLGNNFLTTLLSGGGLSSALSASLGQLQPALFQIAQGGAQATAAFNALGITGTGAVSALTQGLAVLGVAALTVVPAISAIGNGIKAAYDQQKEFIFSSGILAKQLGTTAEEGAKLRAALTLVGQQDNIFAAITLNQIQASVAALDRVNRGLDVTTPQVEKFRQALDTLGVSYANNNGSLKTFAELSVDISAGLQKLSTAQRSLAIQNLAGLFGSDVAKIFGYGPEGLSSILANATVVTEEQAKANDQLQISLTNLTAAQNQFNITLANGLTPLENWFAQFQTGALREASDILLEIQSRITGINAASLGDGAAAGGGLAKYIANIFTGGGLGIGGGVNIPTPAAALFNLLFPSEDALRSRAEGIKTKISEIRRDLSVAMPGTEESNAMLGNLILYEKELSNIRDTLREMSDGMKGMDKLRDAFDPGTKTNAVLLDQYKELDKALELVQKDEEAVAKAAEAIAKNNAEVAKSFDAQIDALQRTAGAYDSYYTKVGDISTKIGEIQSKAGKQYSFIGTGTVKDVEKAIVDLRVLEERLGKMTEKGKGVGDPKFDQLLLNISRRRTALGLQAGELTDIANVDVTVGISGLGRADKEKLNELFQQLAKFKQEFLQGGFDVTQSTFGILSESIKGLGQSQFLDFLSKGASTLQDYATSLGLFASPGFTQAIGEAALQQKLLAGGFGEIKTAEGAAAAFERYVKAFGDLRSGLFDLSEFIADPSKLGLSTIFQDLKKYEKDTTGKIKIPIAIELGLTTAQEVNLAGQDVNALFGQGQTGAAQQVLDAQRKLAGLGTGQGITAAFFASMGIVPGEAIKASLKMAVDLKVDNSLVDKQLKAQKKLADDLQQTRTLNAQWNLSISLSSNLDAVRARVQAIINALGLPTGTPPVPSSTDNDRNRRVGGEYTPAAAGGNVYKGQLKLVGEEGKPEFFVPRSDGRIIPGNETASIMRMMGAERLPTQASITYAPVSNQYLSVDARGTNARDVTQAIQRTQRKGTLFTSNSDLIRGRDFLRARGL